MIKNDMSKNLILNPPDRGVTTCLLVDSEDYLRSLSRHVLNPLAEMEQAGYRNGNRVRKLLLCILIYRELDLLDLEDYDRLNGRALKLLEACYNRAGVKVS